LNNSNPSAATNIHISRDFVLPPKATSEVDFSGNLDSFQQATNPGGMTQLGTAAAPVLPFTGLLLNAAKAVYLPWPGGAVPGNAMQQVGDMAQPPDGSPNALPNHTQVLMAGAETLAAAKGAGVGTYAWNQQPPLPPAHVAAETVYDSTGNPRQITIQFYQVNDLGTAVPPVNAPPRNQAVYAWYAFDTTNGAAVGNASLVGGTGIEEGDIPTAADRGYDRGVAGNQYWGDFLYFNTDGSLASEGGVGVVGGVNFQDKAHIYLPGLNAAANGAGQPPPNSPIPNLGAEITDVTLNFGTAGMLGFGKRDGVTGDAEGTYQVVNGVNTYIPNSTIFAKTQNGYTDGLLTGVQFDATGTIQGSFSNGQTAALGQIVMAMPENQGGLTKVGSNYFAQSANSGGLFVGLAGQDGVGTVQGNSLEGSNVDLTVELSNMIIAQRGFEVNARVISVENSELQTTTQLGQGG
jgi:flagellar hook-basal body protein